MKTLFYDMRRGCSCTLGDLGKDQMLLKKLTRVGAVRLSDIPRKQFVYLLLRKDAALSKNKAVGVDFGCRKMDNYPFVKTLRYYGVDVNAGALQKGLLNFPQAIAIHSKIEDAEVPAADFAICIHVFFTDNFMESDPGGALDAILSKIKPGGTLIITLPTRGDVAPLLQKLRATFRQVDEIPHGFARKTAFFAPAIAMWYYFFVHEPKQIEALYCRCLDAHCTPKDAAWKKSGFPGSPSEFWKMSLTDPAARSRTCAIRVPAAVSAVATVT